MKKRINLSAGLLMFRRTSDHLEFLLAHPGGPYFQERDEGWWTIPKGLAEPNEDLLQTAIREFQEETGITSQPPYLALGEVKQKGGKVVHAWAFEGDWQACDGFQCNNFRMEWPPRSGKFQQFPEVDHIVWMNTEMALRKINQAQSAFIQRLIEKLNQVH